MVASTETTSVVSGARIATGVMAACEPEFVVDYAGPHDVVRVIMKLLQAQADAIAAQARASVVQNLPAIPSFNGEQEDMMEEDLNSG